MNRNMDGSRWRRRTLVEESVGDSGDSLKHVRVVVGIFTNFVKGIKDAQRRED
jgi:hypothetical protein